MTAPLQKPLRTQLENTVKVARDVADLGRQRLAQNDTAIEGDSDQISTSTTPPTNNRV